MEHLSRRTTNHVDLLCIVAEPTPVGSLTARRIVELATQLPITVRQMGVVWNRAECDGRAEEDLEGFDVLTRVPEDAAIREASRSGESVFTLGDDDPALQAVRAMVERFVTPTPAKQTSKH